jgi:ubiquinone/menaquinone biosynthesis C-methylase UbiE
MTSSRTPDFGRRIASRYDELRPFDAGLETLLGRLDGAAALRGRTVLDVGCGTRTPAIALAQDYGCSVVGVDASSEMVAVAEGKEGLALAEAELPDEVCYTLRSLVIVADAG